MNTMNAEQVNANQLENKIAGLHCSLTYEEIVSIAILMAKEVRDNISMYEGNLNPIWKLWDNTIKALKTRT